MVRVQPLLNNTEKKRERNRKKMRYSHALLLCPLLFAAALAMEGPWVSGDDDIYIKYTLAFEENPKLYLMRLSEQGGSGIEEDGTKPVRSAARSTPAGNIYTRLEMIVGPDDVRCRFRKRDALRWLFTQREAKYRDEILTRNDAVDGPITNIDAIICTSALAADEGQLS